VYFFLGNASKMNTNLYLEKTIMNILSSLFGSPLPSLNAGELNEKLKTGKRPLVVDVRQPEEYRSGHIAGSKLIPLGDLNSRINELPKEREIVCVCASGNRSRSATKLLVKTGYNAFDMQGGMLMWQRAQLPIKKGNAA
jgi:rhodanese-related sulfurtransferase